MAHDSVVQDLATYARNRAGVDLTASEFGLLAEFVATRQLETEAHQLWQLVESGLASPTLLAVLLPDVWRSKPDNCILPREAWRQMFAAVPYTSNRAVTRRPRRPKRLYRGAITEHREGLSWTTKHAIAVYFATHRQHNGITGSVWECRVEPQRLHAYLPGEHEYVADVRGLPIMESEYGIRRARRLGMRQR